MTSFTYNARNHYDFNAPLSDSDDDDGDTYFDVDHEFEESTAVSEHNADASEDERESQLGGKKNPVCSKRKRCERSSHQPSKYVCLAEAIEKFQRTTPMRFHTKPRYSKFEFKGNRLSHQKITVPMSPHLQVVKRNRPVTALSRWQIEDMEIEEMKKNQIKARPVNEKIFKSTHHNVSHQSHVTEVKPFNLTECKKKISEDPLPEVIRFKARPIPKGLFDKKENQQNLSAPNIPMRYRVPAAKNEKENEKKKAPKPEKKGPTQPSPFSFEERDKLLVKKKEEYINKVLEEEKKAREFHANPIPKFSNKRLHSSNWTITSTCTIPQPFNLSSTDGAHDIQKKREKKIEEEMQLLKKAAEFKAKPASVLSQKPFVPKKSEYHFEFHEFKLSSETRAEKRAQYLMVKKEREEELERMKMERKKLLEQREEDEIAELRKKTILKANPIKSYKGIKIRPSVKPLTSPQSPHTFARKHRSFNETT